MKQTIFITGTTSGLGRELARRLHLEGHRLILLGRREMMASDRSQLEGALYCRADLSRETIVDVVDRFLRAHKITRIDWLIHNAGVGYYGPVQLQPPGSIDSLVDVNLWAPIALTHSLLPRLRAAGARSRVTVISSMAARFACPDYAVYAAAKAGVNAFLRSLRVELASELRVQTILPGGVATGMHAKMGIPVDVMNPASFMATADAVEGILALAAGRAGERSLSAGLGLAGRAAEWAPSLVDGRVRCREPVALPGLEPTKRAVVTGAGAGLGRALTLAWLAAGWDVIGADRDMIGLQNTATAAGEGGARFRSVSCDLLTEAGRDRLLTAAKDAGGADVWVHNAGISCVGPFADSDPEAQRRVLDLNLRTPLQLTAGLLHNGLLADGGSVVFVGSLARFTGYPGAAVYAATKAGIGSYARSLRRSLAPRAHVLEVCPGPMRTAHAARYSPHADREDSRLPPEDVAAAILQAVDRRQSLLIPGLANRVMARVGVHAPPVADAIMRRVLYAPIRATGFSASE